MAKILLKQTQHFILIYQHKNNTPDRIGSETVIYWITKTQTSTKDLNQQTKHKSSQIQIACQNSTSEKHTSTEVHFNKTVSINITYQSHDR